VAENLPGSRVKSRIWEASSLRGKYLYVSTCFRLKYAASRSRDGGIVSDEERFSFARDMYVIWHGRR
jgi:hypothetical protein